MSGRNNNPMNSMQNLLRVFRSSRIPLLRNFSEMNLRSRLFCCISSFYVGSRHISRFIFESFRSRPGVELAWRHFLSSFPSIGFIPFFFFLYRRHFLSRKVFVIWSAGGGAPVDASGALHFQSDGNLRLVNGSGAVVWESNTAGHGVSSAVLQDSGNLVLLNSRFIPVWPSFDNPTDTVAPSQNFTVNIVLQSG
ncbi:uncharacterized protein LOC111488944 [Cucurbita maxima]|uniref:Uncharacterized protein LOC111488944 n=1 Tax=Cucurbita maxima TaxID=3661 RepID=A0A6J1JU74_CUCMA|nr:uncharacterized protein LOC111488944 [Cucurbita maxima]